MDFPKSVPGVGLINGQFIDENTTTGQPGSLIPSVWGNSVTHEILSVLEAAGIKPDELKTNQLAEAISKIVAATSVKWENVANKPKDVAGYEIKDVYTKTQSDKLVEGVVKKTGDRMSGQLEMYNGTEDSPEVAFITPTTAVYMDVVTDTFRMFASYANKIVYPLILNIPSKAATLFGSTVWTGANFNPADKVDGDRCTTAGFAGGGDVTSDPYMRHVNGTVVYLASKAYTVLGFQIVKGATGYIKFPDFLGGLILQWTKTPTLSTQVSYTWNFPIRFTNEVFGVTGTMIGGSQGPLEVSVLPNNSSVGLAVGIVTAAVGPSFVFAWGH